MNPSWNASFSIRKRLPCPQSLNRYSYALNNPVKYTDPTGHETQCMSDCDFPADYPVQYDLTDWLVNEMTTNAQSSEIKNIAELGSLETSLFLGLLYELYYGEDFSAAQLGMFFELNSETGIWNFKIAMSEQIGGAVSLCGATNCGWFDYSTPGNIHFGFVAAAAGIPMDLSQDAGGLLQFKDGFTGDGEWQKEWSETTSGEDPRDWAAVQFGYYLYQKYGANMTSAQFRSELTTDVMSTLQEPDWYGATGNPVEVPGPPTSQENQYQYGQFNYE